jgi:hypothetical protein
MKLRSTFSILLAMVFATGVLLVNPTRLLGQSSTAELRGLVMDESGALIPGAKVEVLNVGTSESRTFTTDAAGQYVVSQLLPGTYKIQVEAQGFRRVVRRGVVLQVGQRAGIDVHLQVGAVSESIEVVESAPLLESNDASLGQVIENRKVLDLPLNGRNILALASLTSGVTPGTSFGIGIPDNRAALVQAASSNLSMNGGMTSSNDVLIDGVPLSICCQNQISFEPSIDSTQEFRVRTNMYDAQYGRTGGGVITFASRGGSNQLHGSLYHFLRNEHLDANNFFNNRANQPKAHFVYNQFGGRIGGPIVRNKLFFFFNYEGLRNIRGAFASGRTPTDAERSGVFTENIYDPLTGTSTNGYTRTLFPDKTIPKERMDKVALNLMSFWPKPNTTGVNNFITNAPNTDALDQFNTRIDYNVTAANRLFGRFSSERNDGLMPNTYGNIASVAWSQEVNNYNMVLDDSWTITPTFVANLRYGFTRQRNFRVGYSIGTDLTKYGWPASYNAARQEALLPQISPAAYLGLSRATLFKRAAQAHAWAAQFSKVAGRQFLKFGIDYRLYQQYWVDNGNASGSFSFDTGFTRGPNALTGTGGNAFASFLTGYPSGGSIANVGAMSCNSPYAALFLQDDFRVNDKLTLNLGVRWEAELSRNEHDNRLSYFDPNAPSPLADKVGIPNLKGGLRFLGVDGENRQQATDWNNVGPRVGFSWQAMPKTVVRGGYGVTYLPIQTRYNGTLNTGFAATTSMVTSLDGGRTPVGALSNPFPNGFNLPKGASNGLLSSLGQSFSTLLYDEKETGYSQQWSLDIQRELTADLMLDVAYSGSKGTQLGMPLPINVLPTQLLSLGAQLLEKVNNPFAPYVSTGTLSSATVTRQQLLLPYSQFLGVTSNVSQLGSSIYHALQLKVNKRFSKGFSILAGYTFSKIISDVAGWNTGYLDDAPGYQDVYNRRLDRSIDPQDVSSRLVLSYVWELPFGRGKRYLASTPKAIDLILGGWQVNGMTTFAAGMPLEVYNSVPTISGASRPNNVGRSAKKSGSVNDRLNAYFDTSAFAAPGQYEFGSAPRTLPDIRSDGPRNFDLSLFKNFSVTERVSLQLRGEFFNIFNTPRFGKPNGNFGTSQFGIVSSQANNPRDVQLALRLSF